VKAISRSATALKWAIALVTLLPGSAFAEEEPNLLDIANPDATKAEATKLEERLNRVEQELQALESLQVSATTRLSGQSTFVVGANGFHGSATSLVDSSRQLYGATSFNYDTRLTLSTSFTGSDLLHMRLRAGNFGPQRNSFGGGGPSVLSQLEVAFEERSGADRLSLNRLYYQFPLGDFTFTLGPRVEQDAMLAIWPSLYPSESILDLMTFGGAIGANNLNLGTGAGLWWRQGGFAISALYVAANGESSGPLNGGRLDGGLFNAQSGSTTTLQVGYRQDQWAIAAIYSYLQNGAGVIPYATNFTLNSFAQAGYTSAAGIGGYWQPRQSGWIPSISAGWGINRTTYTNNDSSAGLARISQSWSLGFLWSDAFAVGNTLGTALGQAVYATSVYGGEHPNDNNLIWELWYQIQLTDQLNITPALFYLYRPLGAATPSSESFNQLGGLIKLSLRF
jgi:hypothetical protein